MTIYACGSNIKKIQNRLEQGGLKLSEHLISKCRLLVSCDKTNYISVTSGNSLIKESTEEKLLGVVLDRNLSFKTHLDSFCKTASQKLHVLALISKFMNTDKTVLISNTFVVSQLSHCPLIWTFHDRRTQNKVIKIQQQALRIVYRDCPFGFESPESRFYEKYLY